MDLIQDRIFFVGYFCAALRIPMGSRIPYSKTCPVGEASLILYHDKRRCFQENVSFVRGIHFSHHSPYIRRENVINWRRDDTYGDRQGETAQPLL